jgi:hypothetical protein
VRDYVCRMFVSNIQGVMNTQYKIFFNKWRLSHCTSINSKWIKDLNIRPETLKLLKEGAENTLKLISIGKDFLNRTPAAQQLRERMDKWDYNTIKKLLHNKSNCLQTEETTHRVGENICQLYIRQRTDNENI